MRTLRSYLDLILYAVLLFGFGAYKLVENDAELNSFWSSYFEDLIAIPIILKSSLLLLQLCLNRYRNYMIKHSDLLIIFIGFSLYYEALLPQIDSRFTGDGLDIICYAVGLIIFALFLNTSLNVSDHLSSSARD